jgi:hypothetical protein
MSCARAPRCLPQHSMLSQGQSTGCHPHHARSMAARPPHFGMLAGQSPGREPCGIGSGIANPHQLVALTPAQVAWMHRVNACLSYAAACMLLGIRTGAEQQVASAPGAVPVGPCACNVLQHRCCVAVQVPARAAAAGTEDGVLEHVGVSAQCHNRRALMAFVGSYPEGPLKPTSVLLLL